MNTRTHNAKKRRFPRRKTATPARSENLPQLELVLGNPAHGGEVVARDHDGRVIFVRGGLPGERVLAQVTAQNKKMAWAKVIEVREASPDRIPSVWPDATIHDMGGAELAHVAHQAQLRWKYDVLRDQMQRIGGPDVARQIAALPNGDSLVRPTPGDAQRHDGRDWRSRIECVIDREGRPCMHGHKSTSLIPLTDMPLAMPGIRDTGFLDPSSPWRRLWKPGQRLRIVSETGVPDPRVMVAIGETVYDEAGRPASSDMLRHRVTVGERTFDYRVRMQGFWQAHHEGGEVLVQTVCDFAAPKVGDAVVELYSGSGLFTLPLADLVGEEGHVVTVEGSEEAVADAQGNAAHLPQVETFVGWIDEEAVLDAVAQVQKIPDVIVLDPPRAGAGVEVCARIASTGVPRVVVVSCDLAAGARDLKTLVSGGYRIEKMQAWDLYPTTHHVEVVTLLVKDA